jgi:hypothetical protein
MISYSSAHVIERKGYQTEMTALKIPGKTAKTGVIKLSQHRTPRRCDDEAAEFAS